MQFTNAGTPEDYYPQKLTAVDIKLMISNGAIINPFNGRLILCGEIDIKESTLERLQDPLTNGYGFSFENALIYQGAPAHLLPSYLKYGVLSNPSSPNLSRINGLVWEAARWSYSSTGWNMIVVSKCPWSELEKIGEEGHCILERPRNLVPIELMTKIRGDDRVPVHMRNCQDLRQLSPQYLQQIYFLQRERLG